jgi:hypothetical protein
MCRLKSIQRHLVPGARAVYIGLYRPYRGRVETIVKYGDQISVTLRLTNNHVETFQFGRRFVPAAAYKTRSWDGWEVHPYEWLMPKSLQEAP